MLVIERDDRIAHERNPAEAPEFARTVAGSAELVGEGSLGIEDANLGRIAITDEERAVRLKLDGADPEELQIGLVVTEGEDRRGGEPPDRGGGGLGEYQREDDGSGDSFHTREIAHTHTGRKDQLGGYPFCATITSHSVHGRPAKRTRDPSLTRGPWRSTLFEWIPSRGNVLEAGEAQSARPPVFRCAITEKAYGKRTPALP